MNERLKKIRKDAKMTQAEFGKCVGASYAAISKYELGTVVPDKSMQMLICSKFNVREQWLETGEGEPYRRGLIPRLVQVLQGNPALLAALEQAVDRMDDQDWQNLNAIVRKVISSENSPEP